MQVINYNRLTAKMKKMKAGHLLTLLLAVLAFGCDDSTTGIGESLIPAEDRINAYTDSYEFTTRSLRSDSVYARTNMGYVGRYTDEVYGEFSTDFMAQFTCPDNFEFDEEVTEVTGITLQLSYTDFFGDSLNAMRLQIDTLDRYISEDDKTAFYTNVDPRDYYNESARPLAVKAYSATGPSTVRDSTDGYFTNYRQAITLPTSLGQYIFGKFQENKDYFKDADAFIKNVLKGIYVHSTHGDGTILYISDIQLVMTAKRVTESASGVRDSVLYRSYAFAATKEVIQANHFENSETLDELAADPGCSYVKSPAGIFTELTFPINEIYEEHRNDTLNAVAISLSRYNDKSNTKYGMDVPENLLLLRKKDMYSFFEENLLTDSQTSFTSTYSTSTNTYDFANIAPLITLCMNERRSGIAADGGDPDNAADAARWDAKNPDWNKVVLIPIEIETATTSSSSSYYYYSSSSSTQVVAIKHALGMTSARLRGGTDKLTMEILYTKF